MANLAQIKNRFWDNDNNLLAGGKVYVYEAGTETPKTSYTDSTESTSNANPVILDAKGEANIWVEGTCKINLLTSADVQVTGYPVDYVGGTYADLNGSASQTFSVAPATAAAHAVRLDQFQGWATFTPTISTSAGSWTGLTVLTARYMVVGKLLFLTLNLSATVATGSPTDLRVTLPASLTSSQYTRSPVFIVDYSSSVIGQVIFGATSNTQYAIFSLVNTGAFNGAGATSITYAGVIGID